MLLVGWVELTCGALFPFQVWPLELDSVRTSICPFRKGEQTHRDQGGSGAGGSVWGKQ